MKKLYSLFSLTALLFAVNVNAQIYSSIVETGSRFNPGLGQSGTPKVVFDDINVLSTVVNDADSLGFTRIRVGIRRLANAPAVTVNMYLTGLDPNSFGLDSVPAIPARLIGTFNLAANGPSSTTQILEVGDGTNFFAALPRDTGNYALGFQTAFVGVSLSTANVNNGWRMTSGADANINAGWFYNADSVAPRTAFGFAAPTLATFYIQAFGGPKYASTANDVRVTDVTVPEQVTCFSGPQTISVKIQNLGTNTVNAGAATVTLRVGGANTYVGTRSNNSSIPTNGEATLTFNDVDLSLPGLSLDTAIVSFAGDTRATNDTGFNGSITATSIASYPAVENVEANLPVVSYVEVVNGGQLWGIQDGAVDGAYINTDMVDSLRPRTPGSKFFLFDSYRSPNSTGFISRLFSNCLTFAPQTPGNSCGTSLSFWMSHDTTFASSGFGFDSLYVTVSNDGGLSWQRLAPGISRLPDEGGFDIPGWREEIFDLTAFAGQTIQVGFEGVSDWGNVFGLDDITINSTCVVPVRLTRFNAERFGKSNKVTWQTSQEINTAKFVVELSRDGRNFRSIGEVIAAGNSSTERNYSFIHQLPEKGYNYYRLKMVDRDNSSKYSPVSKLQNLGNNNISSYPNPVANQLNLAIEAENSGSANVLVTDLSGKVLLNKVYSVAGGANTVRVNTSALASGNYIIKVQLDETVMVQKFTKL